MSGEAVIAALAPGAAGWPSPLTELGEAAPARLWVRAARPLAVAAEWRRRKAAAFRAMGPERDA